MRTIHPDIDDEVIIEQIEKMGRTMQFIGWSFVITRAILYYGSLLI